MLNKDDKKPIKLGLFAGFIASLCCVGPLILIVLGIGGASTALSIGKQSPYFFIVGIVFLAVGLGFYYFQRINSVCDGRKVERFGWKRIAIIIILACTAFFIVYYVLLYILVPLLAPIIYQNFYK